MKKGKSKSSGTVSGVVKSYIVKTSAHKKAMKDTLAGALAAVRRSFPKSKFKASHYAWYLSKFRQWSKVGRPEGSYISMKAKTTLKRK